MEAQLKETSNIKRELEITLSKEEFDPYRDQVYKEARKKIQLKGFRKGMVPMNVIKKMYGPSLESDAVEAAVQETFEKEARARDLRPIGVPAVSKMDATDEGGLQFSVVYEILPDFELGDYKGLKARKIYHAVTPEEVERELQGLRERQRKEETVAEIADDEHLATVDLQKLDEEGNPIIGEGQKDFKIYLKREGLNPELKEKLLNKKLDEQFRIELPTGEDESMIPYEVTIKDIKQIVLPELDDEFAAKITGDEENTIDDLKDMIKQSIEAEYETRYSRNFRDELVNQLVEAHEIEAPDSLIMEALAQFLEDWKQQQQIKDLPPNFDKKQFFDEMRPTAERTVKWALIRDKIIIAEELKADEADYDGLATMESERTGIDKETLLKYFQRSEQTENKIISEKALQLLEDYAIVTEEVEDLELQHDHDHAHDHSHDHDHDHSHDHDHGHDHSHEEEAETETVTAEATADADDEEKKSEE